MDVGAVCGKPAGVSGAVTLSLSAACAAPGPFTAQVRQSLATSLRNLGTDYLDSLVLHSPMRTHEQSMTGAHTQAGWPGRQQGPSQHLPAVICS